MLFKKKIERAQNWLKEQNKDSEQDLPSMEDLRREEAEKIHLEKGDLFAMIFAAFFTIVPVCLFVLLLICAVGFLLF